MSHSCLGTCGIFLRPTGKCQLQPIPSVVAIARLEAAVAGVAKLLQTNFLECAMLHGGTKFGSNVKTTHINYDGWLRLHVMTVFARSKKVLYEVSRCQSSVFASTGQ